MSNRVIFRRNQSLVPQINIRFDVGDMEEISITEGMIYQHDISQYLLAYAKSYFK